MAERSRYKYPSESDIREAEELLSAKAKRHAPAIEVIFRNPEELSQGKNVVVLPKDHEKEPEVVLVMDNGVEADPEIHNDKSDVWMGVEAPDGMEFTTGGVLIPKNPLIVKGEAVKGEYVGNGIYEQKGKPVRKRVLKPGESLVTGFKEPHGHGPATNGLTGALVLKISR